MRHFDKGGEGMKKEEQMTEYRTGNAVLVQWSNSHILFHGYTAYAYV